MSHTHPSTEDDAPKLYEICVKGHLDAKWVAWFEGMTMVQEANGQTRLIGPVVDQAALHSLLRKVRDLGLPLVSVIPLRLAKGDSCVNPKDDGR